MKKFSVAWKSSTKPRKQRKYRANAPLHIRHRMMAATFSDELRKQYKKRSMPVRKGDTVVVMRGEYRGNKGKIILVDLKRLKIKIDGVETKKRSGETSQVYVDPSKVMITILNTEDPKRITKKKKSVVSSETK